MADKNCAVNIVPPRIDTLLNGLMSHFKQIDTIPDLKTERYWEGMKPVYEQLISCWQPKACNDTYIKSVAEQDVKDGQEELINKLKTKIDELIHDAAKYRIPKILTDMERARVYESACAQMLMCDVFDNLSNLNMDEYIKSAGLLRLDYVREYAKIEQGNIRESSNQFEVMSRLYSWNHGITKEKHHINSDIAVEILLLAVFYAIMAYVMEKIYGQMWKDIKEVSESVMEKCAG